MNAKVIVLTLALILILPLTQAIEITSPEADVITEHTPAEITLAWNAEYEEYHVILQSNNQTQLNETTTQQQTTLTLEEGEYELTITAQETSTQKTFSVTQQEQTQPLVLNVQTNKNSYMTTENVRITATANQPTTATLTLTRDGEQSKSWDALSISDTLELMYPLEEAGSYQAILQSGQATASTSWTVQETQPLEVGFSHSTPLLNKKTTLSAQVNGGEEPYTYQWSFSDETTNNDQSEEIEHFFLEEGEVDVTLKVTDNNGMSKQKTQTLTVTDQLYTLDVTLMSPEGEPVANLFVELKDPETKTQQQSTTINAPTVTFNELVRGEYTVTIKDRNQTYQRDIFNITKDTSKVYTIRKETLPEEYASEEETTTNETEEADEEYAEEETYEEPEITQEEIQRQQLYEQQEQAKEQLQQKELSFKLDNNKDEVLEHLGYYEKITRAINELSQAQNQEEIQTIINKVPTEVHIKNSLQTQIRLSKQEINDALQEFFIAEKITDEKEQEAYQYSVEAFQENISITETTYTAEIIINGQTQTHQFVKKEISAPQTSRIIEIISPSFIQSTNQLTTKNNHKVLRDNPVIEFTSKEYLYSSETNTNPQSTTIVIPENIQNPPSRLSSITGMAGVSFETGDARKAIIYIIIIAFSVAGVTVGKRMYEPSQQNIDAFCELAGHALDELQGGNSHAVAELAPEIISLHKELSKLEQEQSQEIIDHLQEKVTLHHFQQATKHVYNIGEHADINTLSAAYEEALQIYQQLSKHAQQEHNTQLKELEAYLDAHIT